MELTLKNAGNVRIAFERSAEKDVPSSITIEGNGLGIIAGMTMLVAKVSDVLRDGSDTLHSLYLISMLEALRPDNVFGKDTKEEPDSDTKASQPDSIHPFASPDQEQMEAMLDKLFGGAR